MPRSTVDRGDPPQKEWRVAVKNADAQTAQFADETEGSISAVIASPCHWVARGA